LDLATLVGLLGGFAIVVFAMVLGGSLGMFVDVPSILIVIVGSLLVCMMKFSLGQFLGATKTVAKAFMFKLDSAEELIANVKELADEARKGGLLALEGKEISNDFLKRGIGLLIDGHEADVVRNLLVKDKNQAVDRHKVGSRV
jgi:chemotaxis protein MotA